MLNSVCIIQTTGDEDGVDVWAEQWSSVPFIAPGMIDGKGPYYDEWEVH